MPLIYINAPVGTFEPAKRDDLADTLTTIALDAESLPNTPFVRSTTWIYFRDYDDGTVYHGGKPSGRKVISIEVNAFQGGLDVMAKKKLISGFTGAIAKALGLKQADLVPVYIVLRDVPTIDWGVFGKTITLDDLRNPAADAAPI
ncbi:tautomerase family protein [Acetobacter suratthaniensis]|uniref:Tautomerase family protein n=1 Tax=Acetobacter suratthaniensis TaxID=1502841 RepID=A0ABS3LPN6_9PROT|nr:tautomerase family protein [Acetobacter suratthaniensis]MBO1329337.1 tautomerase family protein [Acetobacter suratthaniensis]MCX2567381.1 tautomerase family protein [Acetobacter suratthaniensis]